MPHDPHGPAASRRGLIKGLAFIPATAVGIAGALHAAGPAPASAPGGAAAGGAPPDYRPTFFDAAEWAFLQAACDRLVPRDAHGPGALDLGAPEFIDRHMQTPYAAGDIWYLEGPFLEAPAHFGYQGRLPLRDILRVGIRGIDAHCVRARGGARFAALDGARQDEVLRAAEDGKLGLEEIPEKYFFGQLLNETRFGCFCDPRHGGNRGMGGWKMIGYPGMRADYLDWVEVRDRPYPIPPVDLAGRRG